MDLRAKIAEALYEPPDQLVAESAFGGLVLGEAKHQANRRADAVMGVIERRLSALETENDRQASGDPWDCGYLRAIKDMRGEK